MRINPMLMTVFVVTAASVVLTGGALATPVSGGQTDLTGDALRVPDPVVDNDTEDGTYVKGEPTAEELDKPVDLSSAPEGLSSGDGVETSGDADASSIVMDPSDDESDHEAVGTTRYFLTSGPDGYVFTEFTLLAVGNHSEVWVANDMAFPDGDPREDPTITEAQAEAFRTQFEVNMYPAESRVFGTPDARNGTDSLLEQFGSVPDDYYQTTEGSKTAILVHNIYDENYEDPEYPIYIAGYYSPTVQQYSDRNVINVDSYGWDDVNETHRTVGYEGTLAHEYQHLIHGDLDGDETSWINEGMSDYAEVVTGYGVSESHVSAYEQLPYNSLTNWEDQGAINVLADYGSAFVFQMYLADQFGVEFISNLAHEEANGIEGVERTLDETDAKRDFYGLYQDFSTAVVTDDVESPPRDEYHIDGIDLDVNTSKSVGTAGVWGTNYEEIDVSERGPITDVTVSGTDFTDTEWRTATDPVDGEGTVLYSGSGNLLDRHAILATDLSEAEDTTLSFETYYDIEHAWDYGFVQVSTDGGETWQSVETEQTSTELADGAHPTVRENVPGYTGSSDGWVQQSVDLSEYADEERVLVSFRYTTDWAFVMPGMYVRNVSVAGEPVATDTAEPYMSLREATGDHVEYQFTFLGVKDNGNYQVKQLDMRTFSDGDKQELKEFLRNGNFETVIVASTWAAEDGESGRVPVGVEFDFARDEGENEQ